MIASCNGKELKLAGLGDSSYNNLNQSLLSNTNDMTFENSMDRSQIMKDTLSTADVKVNLFIMVTIWGVTVFNFYLILYLVNTFD